MRLLFVGKRHPQQRDLIERPYGRFYHLPVELAALGHDVHVALSSHQGLPSLRRHSGGVHWSSRDVRTLGPLGWLRDLDAVASQIHPDWIVGISDAQYGWLARRLARSHGARLAIDAYDNYEAYMPGNLPLHWAWRRSIRAADLVTAAGPQLATLMQSHRRGGRAVDVLPMAADPAFHPRDKGASRNALGLPAAAPLLGYVGSWTRSRGTHLVTRIFERVRSRRPDARLVLSGRPPARVVEAPGVVGLGYLPDSQLPILVSALDVACILTADTPFGRYSYPAKLCEAMACGIPVVASATDATRWMLDDRAPRLAAPGDAGAFADRVLEQLSNPMSDYGLQPRWVEIAARLEQMLLAAAAP